MAPKKKAPAPVRPSEEAADQALAERLTRASMVLRVKVPGTGVSYEMPTVENLPISFRRKVKQLTGRAVSDLGVDPLHQYACYWWVSRLLAGEKVSLTDVEDEWDERCKGTRLSDLDVDVVSTIDEVADALDADEAEELSPES